MCPEKMTAAQTLVWKPRFIGSSQNPQYPCWNLSQANGIQIVLTIVS